MSYLSVINAKNCKRVDSGVKWKTWYDQQCREYIDYCIANNIVKFEPNVQYVGIGLRSTIFLIHPLRIIIIRHFST